MDLTFPSSHVHMKCMSNEQAAMTFCVHSLLHIYYRHILSNLIQGAWNTTGTYNSRDQNILGTLRIASYAYTHRAESKRHIQGLNIGDTRHKDTYDTYKECIGSYAYTQRGNMKGTYMAYTRDTSHTITYKRCSPYAYRQNHRIKGIYKAYTREGQIQRIQGIIHMHIHTQP